MENLTFNRYYSACDEMFREIRCINSYAISDGQLIYRIDDERSKIVWDLSEAKQNHWRKKIRDSVSAVLSSSLSYSAIERLIDDFIRENLDLLSEALVDHEREKMKEEMRREQFQTTSTALVSRALDGSAAAVEEIVTGEANILLE